MNNLLYKADLPLIIAHRGESYDAPENTLSAINLAWERGADGCEIDVQLTKDNQIVVIHNKRTKMTSGKSLRIKSHTLQKLKSMNVVSKINNKRFTESIPSLNEVLLTVPPHKYLFIEIKCDIKIIPHLKKVLSSSQLNSNQIKIIGFGLNKMTVIKKNFQEFEVFLNRRVNAGKVFSGKSYWDNLIKKIKLASLDGLNISYTKSLNINVLEKFKLNKLKMYVWTINNPKRALRLISIGVNGFMSDRSGWIKEKIILQ